MCIVIRKLKNAIIMLQLCLIKKGENVMKTCEIRFEVFTAIDIINGKDFRMNAAS